MSPNAYLAMSTDAAQFFDAALSLSDDDRAQLAYQLLQSLKPPGGSDEDESGFDEKLARRLTGYNADKSVAADWDDVARRVRDSLREKRTS